MQNSQNNFDTQIVIKLSSKFEHRALLLDRPSILIAFNLKFILLHCFSISIILTLSKTQYYEQLGDLGVANQTSTLAH